MAETRRDEGECWRNSGAAARRPCYTIDPCVCVNECAPTSIAASAAEPQRRRALAVTSPVAAAPAAPLLRHRRRPRALPPPPPLRPPPRRRTCRRGRRCCGPLVPAAAALRARRQRRKPSRPLLFGTAVFVRDEALAGHDALAGLHGPVDPFSAKVRIFEIGQSNAEHPVSSNIEERPFKR